MACWHPALLLAGSATYAFGCGDGGGSVLGAESDSFWSVDASGTFDQTEEAPRDIVHETADASTGCYFDTIAYHYLIEGTDVSDSQQFWLAFMPGGYLVGRNTSGEGASEDCYQVFWRLLECDTDRATVRINGGCTRDGLPERTLLLARGGLDDVGLPTVIIEPLELTISTIAIPAELDAICQTWVCDELLPPFPGER